jgi:cytochrome c biogenesis factor
MVLAGVTDEDTAELRISFNPLVWWVWVGGFVMAIGGLIVMWPQRRRSLPASVPRFITATEPARELVEA